MSPLAVRRGAGPVHLAAPTAATTFQAACGARFRGIGVVVAAREWRRGRRCPECESRAIRARNDKELATIAGW